MVNDLTNREPIEWARGNPERRCTAHKKNGEQCRRWAIKGGTVCRYHGGAAPQVLAKAREALALAAYHNVKNLQLLADDADSEAVRLAATNSALDRTGIAAKTQVEVGVAEPKPWEDVLNDIAGIAQITQDESRARRGLPPAEQAALPAAPPALPALDVEAVEVPPDSSPSHADDADRADTVPPQFAEPSDPPTTPGLQTLEEAVTSARVVHVRRVR